MYGCGHSIAAGTHAVRMTNVYIRVMLALGVALSTSLISLPPHTPRRACIHGDRTVLILVYVAGDGEVATPGC